MFLLLEEEQVTKTGKKSKGEAKHAKLCEIIKKELDSRGFDTIINVEYKSQLDGEIDVVGFSDDGKYAIDVEVKCNDNYKARTKAYDQLDRAEKYFHHFKNKRLFKMYAFYNESNYTLQWYN